MLGQLVNRRCASWSPTSRKFRLSNASSWLNLVEPLVAEITRQRIGRGTFTSVPELIAAIEHWIAHRNANTRFQREVLWESGLHDGLCAVQRMKLGE
jgi:hypothetical protein